MKAIVVVLGFATLLFAAVPVWSQEPGIAGGGALPPNLVPMYGGVEKTPAQKASDEAFIAEATKLAGSREKASEAFVTKGWQAFFQTRDPATAMMRFNQAWLLNPDNPRVMHGFGVVSGAMSKLDVSAKFLTIAAEKEPGDPKILIDLGYSLTLQAAEVTDPDIRKRTFARSLECFANAEKIDPTLEPLYFNWAVALFYSEDYPGAWEKVAACEKLGGKSLDPRFLADLESRLPRPAP